MPTVRDSATNALAKIAPQVSWGTNPGQVAPVNGRIPKPAEFSDLNEQKAAGYYSVALGTHALRAGRYIVAFSAGSHRLSRTMFVVR